MKFDELPEVRKKDGEKAEPEVIGWLLIAHETLTMNRKEVVPEYMYSGICPEAEEIIQGLDETSLQEMLNELAEKNLDKYVNTKKKYLTYPICRYANESVMAALTKRAPEWKTGVSGINAPPLLQLRQAVLYSNTQAAMMFAEKYHQLDEYARLRETDAQTIRDVYMSDLGLDENGKKVYDLGNTTIELSIGTDLNLVLYDPINKKIVKSIPKKGADEEKYVKAKTDLSNLKKNIKRIIKARTEMLFEAFLDGREFSANQWKNAYLNNPLLNHVANLIVWEQAGKTFTLKEKTITDISGGIYELTDEPVKVAHPMEMGENDTEAWKTYFIDNHMKQPFEQVWEPVRKAEEISENRYEGSVLPLYRFVGKDKHGIIAEGFYAYSENYSIKFTDCDLKFLDSDWRLNMNAGRDTNVTLDSFEIKEYTRYANHIVALLDQWTAAERVLKDDITVTEMLPGFTQAQVTEFIKIAGENDCTNVKAAIMDYANNHFDNIDLTNEFTLDL